MKSSEKDVLLVTSSSSGGISALPSASPPKVTSSLPTFAQAASTAHMPLSSTPVIDDVLYGQSRKFPMANCSFSVMHCNFWGLLGNFKKGHTIAGYTNKIDYLHDILSFNELPSVFCATETKLGKNIPDSDLAITSYMLFRRDRNHQEGGVAIYCKQTLNPRLIDDLTVASIEAVAIKIQYQRNSPMIVCCIYRPPKMNADWTNTFCIYLSQLTILSPNVLLLGDFNSDLLVLSDFSDEILHSFDLQQIVKTPTRITESTATLLNPICVPRILLFMPVQLTYTLLTIMPHTAAFVHLNIALTWIISI